MNTIESLIMVWTNKISEDYNHLKSLALSNEYLTEPIT